MQLNILLARKAKTKSSANVREALVLIQNFYQDKASYVELILAAVAQYTFGFGFLSCL
jgi:hypothetical protein